MTIEQSLQDIWSAWSDQASAQLKVLLETKHLYQKVDIAPNLTNVSIPPADRKLIEQKMPDILTHRFTLAVGVLRLAERGGAVSVILTLSIPNVSLFCGTCNRIEVFAPIWWTDSANEMLKRSTHGSQPTSVPEAFQMFTLMYQCQKCWGAPEALLVRREGNTLGLHGRSPIEFVEIPSFIPKQEAKHYRDAIVAFNSGKTLAGLFYLRTLIEHFGRRVTGKTGKVNGDEIFEAYSVTLPENLKSVLPSLREWFEKISEALHSANEDPTAFESAKSAIEKHFDMRRVHGVPEPKPGT
jgi:hypothetical protein